MVMRSSGFFVVLGLPYVWAVLVVHAVSTDIYPKTGKEKSENVSGSFVLYKVNVLIKCMNAFHAFSQIPKMKR